MIEQHVIEYIYENELVHFRKKFGDMKGYADLLSQASFLFTNGNPYLDFAHPTLHKTVMIGGISVEQDAMNMKEIDQKWSTILSARPHTVLISFGSMAKSIDMPVHYRQALLDTFSSFPNVTFIWKYENEDSSIAADHPNVYLSSWVPQTALLTEYLARPESEDVTKLKGQAFVDYINQQQSFFTAEYSPDAEQFVKSRIMDVEFVVDPDRKEPKDVLANTEFKIDIPEK
ncbi:hypothetical protein Y032_0040g229 [Ancylostoma ceylanicum]|uniref:glucuronosyltransferase n=1 Tax=Ancylostoma ceylanicum TaxID=53326 RepID=A0A016UGL1_9BILA|nr:hypothetical protein Y032_0040g229 [Ancylostoma ceylanicum]